MKCWRRAAGEVSTTNAYAEWAKTQDESYRTNETARLLGEQSNAEVAIAPGTENLKSAKWTLATNVMAQAPVNAGSAVSNLHAVERIPSEGRGKAAQFIPIRFIYRNKLTKDDKLLVAFDALVLSEMLGREVSQGKIIHGDDHAALKVKTSALAGEVRKRAEKIAALLSNPAPPDLVLNRHCAECEFRGRCRQKAIETDDLSLLAGMSAKERQKLRSKGIFTVTQLSYTFRPRRRPKRQRDKREKYHHSLKALAIREQKIHIVGSPELKIDGTPVYLDVEGLPDRDFYYLIGLRIGHGESAVQHSLWADTVADEGKIWREFLAILETVEKPVLIHYGSYETNFMKQMKDRHSSSPEGSLMAAVMAAAINLVSVMFAQTYFPTYSNGLKEVAGWLRFKWSEPDASGSRSVTWRHAWTGTREPAMEEKLITYNAEDCEALALVERTVSRIADRNAQPSKAEAQETQVVRADDLKHPRVEKWRKFSSQSSELEFVNNAAHWDYQRDRIYVRSSKRLKRARQKTNKIPRNVRSVDRCVKVETSPRCPRCGCEGIKRGRLRSKTVHDIFFGRFSLMKRVFKYKYQTYWCGACKANYGLDEKLLGPRKRAKFGRSLYAYVFYQTIDLCIPMQTVTRSLRRLFGLDLDPSTFNYWKKQMAHYYSQTHQQILKRIVSGGLIHADETHANIQGMGVYVWVFTNMHEVAYLYSDNRESELAQKTLGEFKGVLVSDFYAVYDSFDCPQQKCLIHLVRDLNGAMLENPYDEEMKHIVTSFGQLLKTIVEDVDRHGLKKHFLRKHITAVDRFYRKVVAHDYKSPAALTCVERFEKNRDKLFTFLNCDGVPWNNNNAEHAIKAFARLRDHLGGCSTEKGLKDYLTLLSVCQTCKYMGVDFLDFLRSGETDIQAFAAGHPKPTRQKFVTYERKHYDESFKRSAVEHWQSGSKTARAVAADLGIHPWNLRVWRRHFFGPARSGQQPKAAVEAADE
jgi:predicted RecB family nuclease